MMKDAVFTICAKNYLAQALTLRESVLKHNPKIDFYLFLSDLKDADSIPDVVELDESWLPGWKNMAFKYDVIEFSTSIKPFCFHKLFEKRYEKVIYLDPDIYVTAALKPIYDMLEDKSIVLSPHYCNIQMNYTGCVPEEELLFVGIYNLGFTAIKNNQIGQEIIQWWMNRLANKCYADHHDALHVDQRWMDFIPCFFPNETLITHHMGINPAIWNLHERKLIVDANGIYSIQNLISGEIFPLLFFHFSGFDPFVPTLVNRRHPKYNTDEFPSFIPLFKEYIEAEYRNNYDYFHHLTYSFNSFSNGENILPLYRRWFRVFIEENEANNPFDSNGIFYRILETNKVLSGRKTGDFNAGINREVKDKASKFERWACKSAFRGVRILGIRYYFFLLKFLAKFSRYEYQYFLLKQKRD